MNILRIEAHDFRSWHELDFTVPAGLTLISGVNGAGKSSVLDAVEFALYGATSDAGRLIRRGTDKATVEVRVETEQGLLFVERSVRRDGRGAKVSLDVLQALGPDDVPEKLTAATTTETQKLLTDLLGVDRETFRASAYSAQNDSASFCEAKPGDRKRILGDILGLGMWDGLYARARAQLVDAKRVADVARAELERLNGAGERLLAAHDRENEAGAAFADAQATEAIAIADAEDLAQQAETAREARRQHQAAQDAHDKAVRLHAVADRDNEQAAAALARARAAAAISTPIVEARAAVVIQDETLANAEIDHERTATAARKHSDQVTDARRNVEVAMTESGRLGGEAVALERRLASTTTADVCQECHQPLLSDEARALPDRLRAQLEAVRAKHREAEASVETWDARVQHLEASQPAAPNDTVLRTLREHAQEARAALATAEATLALAGSLDEAEARARETQDRAIAAMEDERDALDTGRQLLEQLAALTGAEERHQAAAQTLATARAAHSAAAAELARAEEARRAAETEAAAEASAAARATDAARIETELTLMASGFSPNGVPALILENSALPALEAEANRVLGELQAPVRVELRSQRLLSSRDDLADTLDIVAIAADGEAPYETLSGGERTRLAIALRAALTRLLASKRGARVRILVIDEPAGLDRDGSENLAGVLREFVTAGVFDTVLLVTHQTELADQIGRVIRVQRAPGGDSRLAESTAGSLSPQTPSSDPAEHRDRKAARVS